MGRRIRAQLHAQMRIVDSQKTEDDALFAIGPMDGIHRDLFVNKDA